MSNVALANRLTGALAADTASDKMEGAKDKAAAAHANQKEMQHFIKKKQEEIEKLNAELKEAQDTSFWEDVGNFFTGSDGGVGELGDKISQAGAEMKYKSEQLKVEMKKLESAMNDGMEAQNEYQQSLSQHRATADGPQPIPI